MENINDTHPEYIIPAKCEEAVKAAATNATPPQDTTARAIDIFYPDDTEGESVRLANEEIDAVDEVDKENDLAKNCQAGTARCEHLAGDADMDGTADVAAPRDDPCPTNSSTNTLSARRAIRQRLLRRRLALYVCQICHDYVGCPVVTICGHLYCWPCLWPNLHGTNRPHCPSCQRRLILHEDIMPLLSEGPLDKPNDNYFLAQPESVPRPMGLCLDDGQYPNWFLDNERMGLEGENNVSEEIHQLITVHPKLFQWKKHLNWFQKAGAAMILLLWSAICLRCITV